ncbi:hypothetical protein [Gimesia chilikensis]|uniref:hypothetical protein n=1 Tax=Gimesia chilikensis TaxID=2605989 RepID=UPI0018D83603|nr:hypothetical protein [Gimesia chilikensis]
MTSSITKNSAEPQVSTGFTTTHKLQHPMAIPHNFPLSGKALAAGKKEDGCIQ